MATVVRELSIWLRGITLFTPPAEEREQLRAVADAQTAAAGAGGHPATLAQHARAQRRQRGGRGRLGLLRSQGGARGEGQRFAPALLRPHGHRRAQVRCHICHSVLMLGSLFFTFCLYSSAILGLNWTCI